MCHSRSCAVANPWPRNASHSDSALTWGTPQPSRNIFTGPRSPSRQTVVLTSGRAAKEVALRYTPVAMLFPKNLMAGSPAMIEVAVKGVQARRSG